MRKSTFDAVVLSNKALTADVFCLTVSAPEIINGAFPGMFFQLRIFSGQGILLRRPISIADIQDTKITFIYRVIGKGTAEMKKLKPGDVINCLGPLGNGFSLSAQKPLLIGGGMGAAPLLYLAKMYDKKADLLIGSRNSKEMFWPELYKDLLNNIYITTDDGSVGTKGFTVDLLPVLLKENHYDALFVCGPEIMMRGIYKIVQGENIFCQVSLEKRMACGLGACLSCSIDTKSGRKKVCTDGPVFKAQEVL